MPATLVESLEPYKTKVIPFLNLRRALNISPNTDLDRHLAIVIDRSNAPEAEAKRILGMNESERTTYIVKNALTLTIDSLKGNDERTTRTRQAFESNLKENKLSHIVDYFLPQWYHAAKPPFSAYSTFVERHRSEISV